MSSIGRLTSYPQHPGNWDRIQDKYGNNWDIKKKYVEDKTPGEKFAYRLDFSDPMRKYPQAIPTSDD